MKIDICSKTKKHCHKSEGAAWAHSRALKKRFPKSKPRYPFLCGWCGFWHVGRLPRSKKVDKPFRGGID